MALLMSPVVHHPMRSRPISTCKFLGRHGVWGWVACLLQLLELTQAANCIHGDTCFYRWISGEVCTAQGNKETYEVLLWSVDLQYCF